MGVVAEVHGDQGVLEALKEVVGQAPEEAVDMEFLLEVGLCLEVQYGAKEEVHEEEERGKDEGEKHGEEVGPKVSGEET